MQLRKLLLPGLLSVTLLSGCSLFSGEEDVVKMSPLPTVTNQFNPSTAWSTSVGSGIGDFHSNLHPALDSGVVYAADRRGTVKAVSASDGKEVWSVNLAEKSGWFSSSPALLSGGVTVAGGHVYVGSEKAKVYALNTNDGSQAWKTNVAGEALSRPVVSDGLVLIHTSNGQLQALNESDGAVKWTVNLDMPSLSLRGESAPATAYGAAIVGGDNGRVSAVLMQQGQMIWQQRISQATGPTEIDRLSDVDTTPVIVNGVVYALAYNGNLTALDLRSGQIMWKRELGSVSNFIVDGNRIYMIDQNDRVLALTTDGGVTLWTQSDLLHRNLTAPALYNGYIVTGDSEGYMHWINVEDGRFVAQQKVDGSGFLTDPVAAEGKLLIQAKDGTLYAITR
ncbi:MULTISPECIES: outer membrane protein assembly factor BamB [Enterobacteriaceae]|jgi:outer membrane protein assembly factor BamB|uniref:Outer membrane protein assembly factor BamB n=2 Tax=Enterobacteriaceae TaxID=543 RepID=A0ABW1PZW4_9ENTR|nr:MULTISPECIES: outer membrane protein assembly factor BamB [Phytobacter]AUU92302.1 outer membrane protein assembly factor BamB [Enterobacteriaceae bacterium ENNIH3]AUV07654.1 outer membrane protein assembly factor BamB [Enterobacteriaceae bacterium ENNIH2]MBS6737542.1 outer membrane protein assembly factor BamB [Enterobacteriaceae bacterium]PTA95932.1 outer membrane protein assembly factor BamB [Kluyvera sp. Nf5]PWF54169.1 outer membrane protein assembly factor BamB [[Kluyvera] intestini]QI